MLRHILKSAKWALGASIMLGCVLVFAVGGPQSPEADHRALDALLPPVTSSKLAATTAALVTASITPAAMLERATVVAATAAAVVMDTDGIRDIHGTTAV